jgi:hypothetical protein
MRGETYPYRTGATTQLRVRRTLDVQSSRS